MHQKTLDLNCSRTSLALDSTWGHCIKVTFLSGSREQVENPLIVLEICFRSGPWQVVDSVNISCRAINLNSAVGARKYSFKLLMLTQ